MPEDNANPEQEDRLIPVRVVEVKGQSALVEFESDDQRLQRRYVPAGVVEEGRCAESILDLGIPYGIPWADRIDLSGLTPLSLERDLHQRGVWTEDDLRQHANVATRIAVNTLGRILFACIDSS